MHINSLVLNIKKLTPQNSYYISQTHDYLFIYGNNPLYSVKVPHKKTYTHKDDKGEYRVSSGGKQTIRFGRDKKIYKDEEKQETSLTSVWSFSYGRTPYPTQKPYKLLERIICLSTV